MHGRLRVYFEKIVTTPTGWCCTLQTSSGVQQCKFTVGHKFTAKKIGNRDLPHFTLVLIHLFLVILHFFFFFCFVLISSELFMLIASLCGIFPIKKSVLLVMWLFSIHLLCFFSHIFAVDFSLCTYFLLHIFVIPFHLLVSDHWRL